MSQKQRLNPVDLVMMWHRALAIVEEAAHHLLHSAFSSTVREAYDFGVVLLDAEARLLAQATIGHHMFSVCLPHTATQMLQRIPPQQLGPGDVLLTNDPWIGTGHLNDLSLLRPVFYQERLVGYLGSVAHYNDIGGGTSPSTMRQVYEEGLRLPPMKLVRNHAIDQNILDIFSANVRGPEEALGDLYTQLSGLEAADKAVQQFLKRHRLPDLEELATEIIGRTEEAMRSRIRDLLPGGVYRGEIKTDGYEEPLQIKAAITVEDDQIVVDYAGSSNQINRGINSSLPYTFAYTVFALKCVLDPTFPNNHGAYAPIDVRAPAGSFLNSTPPAPVRIRGRTGQYLPGVIFSTLAQAVPERVMGESGQPMWWTQAYFSNDQDKPVAYGFFTNGGQGGRNGKDGLACLAFPSPIATIPVEVVEQESPLLVREKKLRPDSGGAGRYRGGLGQRVVLEARGDVTLALSNERTRFQARGVLGGCPGAVGKVLHGEEQVPGKVQLELRPGEQVTLLLPGGGGYGAPEERDASRIEQDIRNGYVTIEGAQRDYGYVSDTTGKRNHTNPE